MSNPQKTDSQPASETFADSAQYSGETLLKMPKTLHRKLAEAAEQEGIELNQYLLTLLSGQEAIGEVQHRLDEVNRQLARQESLADARKRTAQYHSRYIEDIESGLED